MGVRGTNGCNDTFADTCYYRLLTSTTDQTVDIGTDCYSGLGFEFNAIFGDCRDQRSLDNLGVNAHLYSFQYITSGQINRRGSFKDQRYISALGGYEGIDNSVDIAAGQEMGFQLVGADIKPGFCCFNLRSDDAFGNNP